MGKFNKLFKLFKRKSKETKSLSDLPCDCLDQISKYVNLQDREVLLKKIFLVKNIVNNRQNKSKEDLNQKEKKLTSFLNDLLDEKTKEAKKLAIIKSIQESIKYSINTKLGTLYFKTNDLVEKINQLSNTRSDKKIIDEAFNTLDLNIKEKLKLINFRGANLKYFPVLKGFKELHTILLQGNNLEELNLQHLKNLKEVNCQNNPNLRKIYISGNPKIIHNSQNLQIIQQTKESCLNI